MNKVKANKIDIIVPYYYTDDNFLLFDAFYINAIHNKSNKYYHYR